MLIKLHKLKVVADCIKLYKGAALNQPSCSCCQLLRFTNTNSDERRSAVARAVCWAKKYKYKYKFTNTQLWWEHSCSGRSQVSVILNHHYLNISGKDSPRQPVSRKNIQTCYFGGELCSSAWESWVAQTQNKSSETITTWPTLVSPRPFQTGFLIKKIERWLPYLIFCMKLL